MRRCVAQSCVSYSIKAIEIPLMKFYWQKLKNFFIIISFSLIQYLYISLIGKMFCFALVGFIFIVINQRKEIKMSSVYSVFYFLSVFDNKKKLPFLPPGSENPKAAILNNIFFKGWPNREIVSVLSAHGEFMYYLPAALDFPRRWTRNTSDVIRVIMLTSKSDNSSTNSASPKNIRVFFFRGV